jgi:hypothetical protein
MRVLLGEGYAGMAAGADNILDHLGTPAVYRLRESA